MFNGSKIKLAVSTGLAVAGIGIAALAAAPAYAAGTTANVGVGNVPDVERTLGCLHAERQPRDDTAPGSRRSP